MRLFDDSIAAIFAVIATNRMCEVDNDDDDHFIDDDGNDSYNNDNHTDGDNNMIMSIQAIK